MILRLIRMIILASLIFCGIENSNGQSSDIPMNAEPGKCYAKCLIPDKYKEVEETFAVFIGEPQKDVQLDSLYFRIEKYTGNLIYLGRINDLNKEQSEAIDQLEKVVIVKNEGDVKNYIEETLTFKKLDKIGGFPDWKEVLCANRINNRLIRKLQESLTEKGYLDYSEPVSELTNQIKIALFRYQKELGLPVGQLDFETLESLNIKA